ncbi:MAG: glutaredoxin family protein [Gammaproteobacteria bacterium]
MTVSVVLYGRRDCHLCADLRDALAAWPEPVSVTEVDVDSDADLVRRYGARVPVLAALDGTEICHYFFDADAMGRYLESR